MSGVKCLKHQNGRQMSWRQMSPQSNVLALNVFDVKSLEVKHPASNVWATNVLGVKQFESAWNIRRLVDKSFVPGNQQIILQIVGFLLITVLMYGIVRLANFNSLLLFITSICQSPNFLLHKMGLHLPKLSNKRVALRNYNFGCRL